MKLSESAYQTFLLVLQSLITIQNIICIIHCKHNKIFYWEIWKTLSEFIQLRVTDWTEPFTDYFWYTSGPIAGLFKHFEAYTIFTRKRIFSKQKLWSSSTNWKYPNSGFSVTIWVRKIFVLFNNFTQCFVMPVSHTYQWYCTRMLSRIMLSSD